MSGMLVELLLAGSVVALAIWELTRVNRVIKRRQQSGNDNKSTR